VTSGTGVLGYRVAISLLEAGHKDVAVGMWGYDSGRLSENSFGKQCADELVARGATIVDFDWSHPNKYETILKGVKTVFCSLPHIQNWADAFPAFLRACKVGKVEHFVKISFLRPTHTFKGVAEISRQYRENVPFVAFHGCCDDLLELSKGDSRISYTILCTSHLMSSPLLSQGDTLRRDHKFVTASYGMGVNYVSRKYFGCIIFCCEYIIRAHTVSDVFTSCFAANDVADAAVVVLLDQQPYRNKVYNLTGPAPIKDSEVVKLLTKYYGTEIKHVQLGYHEYRKDVESRGIPEWMARDAAAMERMKATGIDEHKECYTKDLERIIGKPPESFEAYLTHRSCMRPGMQFP